MRGGGDVIARQDHKERCLAFALALIVLACVIALSAIPPVFEPGFASPRQTHSPSARQEDGTTRVQRVNALAAERDAIVVLHSLELTCPGGRAEAWAEVNSSMPKGYEVIGQCN